jgi:nucleotide-binding universal stress UspA family protein
MEPREEQPAPVLVAFATDAGTRAPVEFGISAGRLLDAPVTVLTVRRGGPVVSYLAGDIDDSAGEDARTLSRLRRDLRRRRIDADVRVVEARTVAGGLAHAVEDLGARMVVVGSSQRGVVSSMLVGGLAERLLHDKLCPVAIVPRAYQPPASGVRVIGAAFAPTPEGREAVQAAATLARNGDAELRVTRVLDRQGEGPAAEAELRDAVAELTEAVGTVTEVRVGNPAQTLAELSREVDLLVMGSRGRGTKRAALLGSVSRRVAEQTACPLLVLAHGAAKHIDGALSGAGAHRPSTRA